MCNRDVVVRKVLEWDRIGVDKVRFKHPCVGMQRGDGIGGGWCR